MVADPFRPPTDLEISEAERKLNFVFPSEYVAFLKGGGNVANAVLEPAVVLSGSGHLDIFEIAESAWANEDVPSAKKGQIYFFALGLEVGCDISLENKSVPF